MFEHKLNITGPATYNGRKVITYGVFYGFGSEMWRNNRDFLVEKWPDSKTWNVLERRTVYGGNGFTTETQTIYHGKNLSLQDARKLCVSLVEQHVKQCAEVQDGKV